jgi:hypothetical protein
MRPWLSSAPPDNIPFSQRSRVPWNSVRQRKVTRYMADLSDAHRQIRLLTARVSAAERAAGMTAEDTAKAERSVEICVRKRRNACDVTINAPVLLAFRLSALHTRLRNAEGHRIARKMFGA